MGIDLAASTSFQAVPLTPLVSGGQWGLRLHCPLQLPCCYHCVAIRATVLCHWNANCVPCGPAHGLTSLNKHLQKEDREKEKGAGGKEEEKLAMTRTATPREMSWFPNKLQPENQSSVRKLWGKMGSLIGRANDLPSVPCCSL